VVALIATIVNARFLLRHFRSFSTFFFFLNQLLLKVSGGAAPLPAISTPDSFSLYCPVSPLCGRNNFKLGRSLFHSYTCDFERLPPMFFFPPKIHNLPEMEDSLLLPILPFRDFLLSIPGVRRLKASQAAVLLRKML